MQRPRDSRDTLSDEPWDDCMTPAEVSSGVEGAPWGELTSSDPRRTDGTRPDDPPPTSPNARFRKN